MFDAHNHLHFIDFDADRDDVIDRAVDAGITGMILAGYDDERRSLSDDLSTRPGVWATRGIHPWAIDDLADREIANHLERFASDDWSTYIAMGELGLDWYRAKTEDDRDRQLACFRDQLAIARDIDIPVVLHCVRANHELIRWLKKDGLPGTGAMLHSFWGSAQEARQFVDIGCHLSIGTQITRSQPPTVVEALNEVGLERLFVETDAPSRPPAGVEADRNEPAHLPCVVESLALVLGTTADRVAQTTDENIRSWLNLGDERLRASSE